MAKIRTVYEIEAHGIRRRHFEGKRGVTAERGVVVVNDFSYTVDPAAMIRYDYPLFPLRRGVDLIYRYMEGRSAPIPPFGSGSGDKEYAAGVLSAFARAKVFEFLRQRMDPMVILAVCLIVANVVLGGIIYSLVK